MFPGDQSGVDENACCIAVFFVGMTNTTATWSMAPRLHKEISCLLLDDGAIFNFNTNDDPQTCTEEYDTGVQGKFKCNNRQCPTKGWSSKNVAITIRKYAEDRYNARIYHQRCQECNTVSSPTLDHSYVERIVYRLKKWAGLEMERPYFSGGSRRPHQSALCEGCRAGHCSELSTT